jgi:hypothetical protein
MDIKDTEEYKSTKNLLNKITMKQETLEEDAERLSDRDGFVDGALFGAKWQAERMYSEEEVYKLLLKHQSDYRSSVRNSYPLTWSFDIKEWFEQFKKK